MYGTKQKRPVKQHMMPAQTLPPLALLLPSIVQGKVLTGLCFLSDSLCSSLRETRRSGNQRAPHPFRGLVSPSYFEIVAAELASAVGPFVDGKLAADLAAERTLVADRREPAAEGIPSAAAVGMRLVAIDMESFQQGLWLLVGKLEVVNQDERLATEICSSSASCVKAE